MSRIVDPKGKIAKAKAKMPSACSVRRSRFCDDIISLRLQGHSYRRIEDWLRVKGTEYLIPAATLCRNLIRGLGTEQEFMPVYEEAAEQNGGDITVDPGRSLAGQALIQRGRIDYMVRHEAEKRRTNPGFANPRIRQELETYMSLVEAAAKYEVDQTGQASDPTRGNSLLSSLAESALAQLILDGHITVPDLTAKKPALTVVGSDR